MSSIPANLLANRPVCSPSQDQEQARPLEVTFDGRQPEYATIDEVLHWRDWSDREIDQIHRVYSGDLRRLSTDRNGVPCDIELRGDQ